MDKGYQQDKLKAIEKFIDIIKLTFDCLQIPTPTDLLELIIANKNYQREFDTHEITMIYEKFERIEKYQLNIITK